MNKIIILLGQRVRSGTNFVGSTMAMHPDVVTFPANKSLGEFNLFNNTEIIDAIFNKVAQKSFGLDITTKDQDTFLRLMNCSKAFLERQSLLKLYVCIQTCILNYTHIYNNIRT